MNLNIKLSNLNNNLGSELLWPILHFTNEDTDRDQANNSEVGSISVIREKLEIKICEPLLFSVL